MSQPDEMDWVVCEPVDRWTRLIRRNLQRRDRFQLIRLPGPAILEDWLTTSRDALLAVEVTPQNVESICQLVRQNVPHSQGNRFVGLCRGLPPEWTLALRGCGFDACYFSLTNVQSLVRLARCHFGERTRARLHDSTDHEPLGLTAGIRNRLPTFKRYPV